jgi:hypothetical protein
MDASTGTQRRSARGESMLQALPVLLLTLGQAAVPEPTKQVGAPASPSIFETARTWTGAESDHLGIGLAVLGDVNEDGHPEFVLGKMTGAYTFCFGPGAARVISGKDGTELYEVRGTNKEGDCGDAYGDTIAPLGDLDRDGAPDFAVGAWRYEEYVGYVTVYSGRTGSPIATIYGGGKVERGAGPVPPETCGSFKGEAFGQTIVPLEDLDEDGIDELAIGGSLIDDHGIFSGKSFERLAPLPGLPLGMTGDIDGDGRRDIVCVSNRPHRLQVVSARTRLPLVEGAIPDGYWSAGSAGDADGDGCLDLIVAKGASPTRPHGPEPKEPIWARWISGKTGEVLREKELQPGGYAREIHCNPMGDLDGDGKSEVLVQTFMSGVGARRWILGGGSGEILAEDLRPSWTDGQRVIRVGDLDGDGRSEFLVADYESAEGTRCGGAVHLGQLRAFAK